MKNIKMILGSLIISAVVVGNAVGAVFYFEPNAVIPETPNHSYDPVTGVLTSGSNAGPLVFSNRDYFLFTVGNWEWLTSNGFDLQLLSSDDPIGASGNWSTAADFFDQAIGSTRFWGIRYEEEDEYGYGWLQVQRTEDTVLTLLASGFNPDGEILAGQGGGGPSAIPEPGTIILMAFGLGGAGLLRRRLHGASLIVLDSNSGRAVNRPRTTHCSNSNIYG